MIRKLIREAKRTAHEHGYVFLRWNVGFTKRNGIECRYPVLEFKKEHNGLKFLEPVLYRRVACDPHAKRIIW